MYVTTIQAYNILSLFKIIKAHVVGSIQIGDKFETRKKVKSERHLSLTKIGFSTWK